MVIVQVDRFNSSRIATVLVVPLTTNMRLVQAPGNVLVAARNSGLPKDSVANVSQLFPVDKSRLAQRAGKLTGHVLDDIEDGLRLIMGL
jgi:mRNA interferase MazF